MGARPAAIDFRGQAARGRPHAIRLQHPEGVDLTLGTATARRRQDAQDQGRVRRRARVCRRKLVVVDFTATWCGPCQMIAPLFGELAEKNPDVVFVKVDVDENQETAAACGINCMPTFQFYKNGAKTFEMQG